MLPFPVGDDGPAIADFANKLFADNAYRDYLEVHGIGVQLTRRWPVLASAGAFGTVVR